MSAHFLVILKVFIINKRLTVCVLRAQLYAYQLCRPTVHYKLFLLTKLYGQLLNDQEPGYWTNPVKG